MSDHIDPTIARIEANPKFQKLRRERNLFSRTLTIIVLLVYYGYIGLIAFDKELLAMPIGNGVTTLGIPLGIGIIVFTILITGVYVYRANNHYDKVIADVLEEAQS